MNTCKEDYLEKELKDCQELLFEVLNQACRQDTGEFDSMALSAYADGLRYLAKHNIIDINCEYGRRVIATYKVGVQANGMFSKKI
jgi:hypothetical protein